MAAYEKYDEEFKRKIIAQVALGKKISDLARGYNISAPLIRYWVQKYTKKEQEINKEME